MKTIKNKVLVLITLVSLGMTIQPMLGMQLGRYEQEKLNREFLTSIGRQCTLEEAKALLKQGASVNAMDEFDYNALIYTILHDQFVIQRHLVQSGADIDLADYSEQNTPLHYSVNHDKFQETKYFIENGAKTDIKNHDGDTAYDLAIERNKADIIAYFDHVNNYNNHNEITLTTPENLVVIPDYLALVIIKNNIWDIKPILKQYSDTTPYFNHYIKLANRLDRKNSVHEIAFLKMSLFNAKPKTEIEYNIKTQKNCCKKLEHNEFSDVMIVCEKLELDNTLQENKFASKKRKVGE